MAALAHSRARLAAPLLLCLLATLHALYVKPYASDFAVVYRAAGRAASGEPLYRLSELNPFKYSPAAALLFAPLSAFSMRAAHALWAALSALCLWRFLTWSRRRAAAALWASLLAAAVAAPYVLHHFALGQCDAVLLALAASSEEDATARPWRSGLLLAVAASIKLPMAALLLPALLFRQWRRMAFAAVAAAALAALAAVHFRGFAQFAAWRQLLAATTPGMLCDAQNQSAWALACAAFTPRSPGFFAALALFGGGAVLLLGAVALRLARSEPEEGRAFAFAASLYLSAFLSPLGWWTNLMAAAPLLALLAREVRLAPRGAVRLVGAAALTLAALASALNFDTVGRALFEKLLSMRHMGLSMLTAALVLAGLLARRSLPFSPLCATDRRAARAP